MDSQSSVAAVKPPPPPPDNGSPRPLPQTGGGFPVPKCTPVTRTTKYMTLVTATKTLGCAHNSGKNNAREINQSSEPHDPSILEPSF